MIGQSLAELSDKILLKIRNDRRRNVKGHLKGFLNKCLGKFGIRIRRHLLAATSPETSELEVVIAGMDFGIRFRTTNSRIGY